MTHPYASRQYIDALATNGMEAVELSGLGTHALLRPIPNSEYVDAMGPYPITPILVRDNGGDLFEELRDSDVVSATFVLDPLQHHEDLDLEIFNYVRPYKTHYLFDGSVDEGSFSKHHQRDIRRAQRSTDTREILLGDYLGQWLELYSALEERHAISALQRFGRSYFEALSKMPELVTVGVFSQDVLVSCHLWITSAAGSYSHLAASSAEGYASGAAYAAYAFSLDRLSGLGPIDLGGVADSTAGGSDGLAKFKQGFSNGETTNMICGKVLRPEVYDALCGAADRSDSNYFPFYRRPV